MRGKSVWFKAGYWQFARNIKKIFQVFFYYKKWFERERVLKVFGVFNRQILGIFKVLKKTIF